MEHTNNRNIANCLRGGRKFRLAAVCLFLFFFASTSTWAKRSVSLLPNFKELATETFTDTRFLMENNETEMRGDDEGDGDDASLISNLLEEAKKYLGRPYRAGHSGPSSFDCSGFVKYIFNKFGMNIGAGSASQYKLGKAVAKQELHSGDLVFFKGRSKKSRVGHVGIVVDVKGDNDFTFIHASSSKGIVIEQFSRMPYYISRFVGAKRLWNE